MVYVLKYCYLIFVDHRCNKIDYVNSLVSKNDLIIFDNISIKYKGSLILSNTNILSVQL
jgi:hypothetical protein